MIRIIDYGIGNVQAFLNVYKRLGLPAERAQTPGDLTGSRHIILPGVGSFDRAMQMLTESGFRDVLDGIVKNPEVNVLGVCVGMQMLAAGSDEGSASGLGWIKGKVRSLHSVAGSDLPTPHMGWNDVDPATPHPLFSGMVRPRFYFLHSYYFDNDNPADSIGTAVYREAFTCAVGSGNILGVQFHPEKSHHWGQQLLGNFGRL